jgi:hypothetical protein
VTIETDTGVVSGFLKSSFIVRHGGSPEGERGDNFKPAKYPDRQFNKTYRFLAQK